MYIYFHVRTFVRLCQQTRYSHLDWHLFQCTECLLQSHPNRHTTMLTSHSVDCLIGSNPQTNNDTHTHTYYGIEALLQLVLLKKQTAGHTLLLAVTASRGEETCQQNQQGPQRDLHRSAHPDRQGWTGAQQAEKFTTRSQQPENLGCKTSGICFQPMGRGQTEWQQYSINFNL